MLVGRRVDEGVFVETHHPDAIVGRLVFIVAGVLKVAFLRKLKAFVRKILDEAGRLTDVAYDHDFQILVFPLESRTTEDQHEHQQDQQASADCDPLAHRPKPGERAHAQKQNRSSA